MTNTTRSTQTDIDKASKSLRQAIVTLTIKTPFLTAPGMGTEYSLDDTIKTACTNGDVIKFNPSFLANMSTAQVIGLVAHENMHVGLGHPWRMKHRDAKLWNIACDCQINDMIGGLGYELPDEGVNYDGVIKLLVGAGCPLAEAQSIRNESVEYTYEILRKYSTQGGTPGKPTGDTPGGNPGSNLRDKLPDPTATVEAADGKADADSKVAEHAGRLENAVDMMEKAEANDKGIQNGTKRSSIPGKLKSHIRRAIENKVDWRSVLWRFSSGQIPADYSYRRVNKFYADDGIYAPVVERIGVGPIAVCLDTSGSINDKLLSLFMAEVEAILDIIRPESIIIIPCDAKVYEPGVTVLYPGDTFEKREFGGRGGTSFKPPFEYLAKHDIHVDKVIYLTDMEGTFPADPGIDTLWVSTVERNAKAPFGDVVVIDIPEGPAA